MHKIMGNKKSIAIFVLPALIVYIAIAIIPLMITAYYSFFDYDGISKMSFTGFSNFTQMFKDSKFIIANKNALILLLSSVLIQLPISFILALTLAKGVKGEKTFRTIYFIPVVISSMVIGRLFINVFNSDYGLLNDVIRHIGFKDFDFPWLTNSKTAFLTTVVPAVWQYIGYHMLIMYAGIKSIPMDYYEAAKIDGATNIQSVFKITIPLLAPVIKTSTVFAVVGSIKSFDLIYVMTGGGPNNVSNVPSTLMYNYIFKRNQYGYGSAQALWIVIECLIISVVIAKIFKKPEENAKI